MERNRLRGRIVEKYGSTGNFAKKFSISAQCVRNILSGKSTPKGLTLVGWATSLDIKEDEIPIFFAGEDAKTLPNKARKRHGEG